MRKFAFALLVGALALYPMGAFAASLIDFNGSVRNIIARFYPADHLQPIFSHRQR